MLVPIVRQRALLQYDLQGLPGAMTRAYGAAQMVDRLNGASDFLDRQSSGKNRYELLIWDGYRAPATQLAIYERYVDEIVEERGLSRSDAWSEAAGFVSSPDSVFPHGTGGTVDLTLLINGKPAFMGTAYDEFVPHAAADWYRLHPPQVEDECHAFSNRELLRAAMEGAGFVVLDCEWWHFEWGTRRWADAKRTSPVLDEVLPPPLVTDAASVPVASTLRQPVWSSGVAQTFAEPRARAAALRGDQPAYHYARFAHPTTHQLSERLRYDVIPAEHCVLSSSGLSACRAVFEALVEPGGCVIYDKYVYYEVERVLLTLAAKNHWTTIALDLSDGSELAGAMSELESGGRGPSLVFLDNPRNWWLDSLDITQVAETVRKYDGRLIVDVSVQPLQDPISLGAHGVVCSLSKYPSLGLTLGGMFATNEAALAEAVSRTLHLFGNSMTPDSAWTVWNHVVSLQDRLAQVSLKADTVASFLRTHPLIGVVRLPDPTFVGGLVGGQIAFHTGDYDRALTMELLVGHNGGRPGSALHLACTFGSCMTTFEHFASNLRKRVGLPRERTNEVLLPDDIVRLGIGCEPVDAIVGDLSAVFNLTSSFMV